MSKRRVGRKLAVDRKAIDRYIEAALKAGLTLMAVQRRPPLPASAAWCQLEKHKVRIQAWLGGDEPSRLVRLQGLLHRDGVSAA